MTVQAVNTPTFSAIDYYQQLIGLTEQLLTLADQESWHRFHKLENIRQQTMQQLANMDHNDKTDELTKSSQVSIKLIGQLVELDQELTHKSQHLSN